MIRRKWILFSSIGTLVLFVASLVRNYKLYPNRSKIWLTTKSSLDIILILLTALKLPRLLVAWIAYWLTKPVKNNIARISIGVGVGLFLDYLSGGFLEMLILLGAFAIDLVTGREGLFGYIDKYDAEEKMRKAA